MKKLNHSSFSFYKKFLSIMFFCAVFANGFFITSALASSENITQINFTTPPQEIMPDTFSSIMTIQTQNISGVSESTSETTKVILSSNSETGEFYNANATTKACTTLLSEPFTITISSGSSNKSFCYKDITSGTYTINLSVLGKDWNFATQDIVIIGEDEEEPPQNTYTEITENIIEDTIWTKEESPYLISSNIYIEENATLNIEAGAIVKFDTDTYLIVDGALSALGTEEFPVVFTSINDDTVGGDTNNDGDSEGNEKDWGYILFRSIDKESKLENTVNKYSSSGVMVYYDAVLNIYDSEIDNRVTYMGARGELDNLKIKGLRLYEGSELTVRDSNIFGEDSVLVLLEKSNLNLINSNIEGDYSWSVVSIYNKSNAYFDNVLISNINENGVSSSVYTESFLEINNSDISSNYNGLEVYDKSSLDFKNSTLYCNNDGIYVYFNSILNMDNGEVSCFHDGVMIYGNVNADIKNSKISDSLDVGILVFNNNVESVINVSKSEIVNNEYGFYVFNSGINANNNYIHDNFSYGAYTFKEIDLDFTSNFWGDKTGPAHSSNAPGLGDPISDHILYDPFLKYNPLEKRKDPVILIPGITGSYLNKDYDDYAEIWPNLLRLMSPTSVTDEFLNELVLNEDGTENPLYPIKTGDIIRGMVNVHIFDKMIEELKNNGYIENENLFVFPYDWRRSTAYTSDVLKEKIDEILSTTDQEKVDIIAHSMGGLVSKSYIAEYGGGKVDQLIFLGTPQLGAPKAFKALSFGDSMGFELFLIFKLNKERGKFISQNMPSVYDLLPSEQYINSNGGYVVDSRGEVSAILDYNQTKNLMISEGRNSLMYPFAENLHNDIDSLDLSGVKSYNFIGCGMGTIGSIELTRKLSWKKLFLEEEDDYILRYREGDTTVPLVSAGGTVGAEIFYSNGFPHESLPASESIINAVLSIFEDKGITFDDNLKDNDSYCGMKGKVISTHSPVSLHIYDEDGNHTGVDENGDIEYGVEGVNFDTIEDVNYAFLPDGEDYKVIIKAEDIGGYDLKVEEQDGDTITNTENWTLVPLKTTESISELIFEDGEYSLLVDDNGDGEIDKTYNPSFDGTEEAKKLTTIKESKRSYSGSYLVNSYKTSNVLVGESIKVSAQTEKIEDVIDGQTSLKNEKVEEILDNTSESEEEYRDVVNEDRLLASVGDVDLKPNLMWPALFLFGVVLILLAKIFIKL